jgi:hypothetical protein
MTAPGIATINPNPSIAAMNFDFINTSTWFRDKPMPKIMQAEGHWARPTTAIEVLYF